MKFIVSLLLATSAAFGEFRGTDIYTIPASGSLSFTNSTSNSFMISSFCGIFSNGVASSGDFSWWFVRGIFSNKIVAFSYTGVTNFCVGVEDYKVFYGRNDVYKFFSTSTNTMYLHVNTRYDTE